MILSFLLLPHFAEAVQEPTCQGKDKRICVFTYDSTDVYHVKGAYGWPLLIIFESDEVVLKKQFLSGYKKAWEFTADSEGQQENTISVMLKGGADNDLRTSLIVTTSKRYYAFELDVLGTDGVAAGPRTKGLTWIARFLYPETTEVKSQFKDRLEKVRELCKREPSHCQYRAQLKKGGNEKELPYVVWDEDNKFYAWFFDQQKPPVPTIVDTDGRERIVNSSSHDGIVTVFELAQEYRFRRGDSVFSVIRLQPIPRTISGR